MRQLPSIEQERFLGVRDATERLQRDHSNALNALEVRTSRGVSVRTINEINHITAYEQREDGSQQRAVLLRVPPPRAISRARGAG